MSLSDYPHTCDIELIDDSDTDDRMGRAQAQATTATAVRCRVNELAPERVLALGREATRHTHRFHFKRDPGVTTVAHLLRHTPPGQTEALVFRVAGTRRPRQRGMPWVVYADRIESGPGQ